MQENFDLPVGILKESSIELGNKLIKTACKRFSRKVSYAKEHRDVLTRRLWTSDPLLYYESQIRQKIRPGNIYKKRKRN